MPEKKFIPIVFFLGFFVSSSSFAEEVDPNRKTTTTASVPSWIGEFKKLDEKELAAKKEGWYVTGLPQIGNDPVSGKGLGVNANLFYNGTKDSGSFEYTPYEYLISAGAYKTTRNTQSYFLTLDAPYFLDTPYRIKAFVGYDSNLHNQYFGLGESSLQPLSYLERNQPDGRMHRNASYSDFESGNSYITSRGYGREAVSTQRNHEYQFQTTYAQFFLDKTIFKVFRIWGGSEVSNNIVRRYDGTWTKAKDPYFGIQLPVMEDVSSVSQDVQDGKIIGEKGGNLNYIRGGIAYDTRDYEPDPDRGWLIEYNFNRAEKLIGSDFSYLRHTFQAKNFWQPFPKYFEELVFAQRVLLSKAEGQVPFFEYRYLYTIDGPSGGLGGLNSLRGYRQERFLGPVIGFYNFELRWRFSSFELWDQFFQISLVPFYDLGRVWDKLSDVNTVGYKHSRGVGLRIVWDQATVILMDWARSKEDNIFFIDMGHTF
ncbi:Omp85 family outer membrane protein [Leptospira idonii]|uniref:Peptide-binding protein n=1 Tax=Leptospira idonii TaxID=1193500 RepID=A0A4V3JY34_9LEPT|nr:DUF5982 domain-containing protein [Leptospira idonii]TGN19736.1 peptide-binding protein [Leptospira idonii]